MAPEMPVSDLETVSARFIRLKDILWGLKEDLLKNQEKIAGLCEDISTLSQFSKYQRLNFMLNAMDRLEVRGQGFNGCTDRLQNGKIRNEKHDKKTGYPGS